MIPFQGWTNCGVIVGLSWIWGVYCQTHTVAHDCEEDEIVKWFPLYEGDAMFPEWIFEAETSNRFLSSVWKRLGPDSPHRLFRVHLTSGAIGRLPSIAGASSTPTHRVTT